MVARFTKMNAVEVRAEILKYLKVPLKTLITACFDHSKYTSNCINTDSVNANICSLPHLHY